MPKLIHGKRLRGAMWRRQLATFPMKVLLVAPTPPPYGGMALQAQQLVKLLRRDGIEVSIVASNFALPSLLRFLSHWRGVRTFLRAGLVWFELWARVREVHVVHIFAASWLYFFIVVYPAVIVGTICGRRVVVNYRGGEAREFFRRYGCLVAPALKLASTVTAPSEFLAAEIRQRFDIPVSVVSNILDNSLFSFRQRGVIRPTLLVTRHLEKIYDIPSVLNAFRTVQKRYPDASLWVAGGGAEEASLRELVSKWELRNVQFLGEVAHRDLPAVYNQCDIYVNASLVDNFPGALLEASAAGLVVVTTAAGGIPFIYENGRTAFLVKPGDSSALAESIEYILEHRGVAMRMAEAARTVASPCEWSEVRKQLFYAYGCSAESISAGAASLNGAGCAAG